MSLCCIYVRSLIISKHRQKAYLIFFDKLSNIRLIPFPTPAATSVPTAVMIGLGLAGVPADLAAPAGAAGVAFEGTDLVAPASTG